jgi:glucose-1-phosphate cytidylyltransferase
MKVVILAGGWGSRLGQQTETIPKPMVPVGNKPILWHIMKTYSYYGFNDFVLSCGVKSQIIKNYFLNYQSYNDDYTINLSTEKINYHSKHNEQDWKVTVVDTGLNTLKGGRIKRVEEYLDNINMLTYGDGLCDVNITELLKFHKLHGKALTITGVHPPARFGEIIEENSKLVSFSEKPQTSVGLINGGYMVFNKNLLNYLTTDEKCDFEVGALEELVKEEEVMIFKHQGNWECMDHERDVEHLNNLWNNNKAFWKHWK